MGAVIRSGSNLPIKQMSIGHGSDVDTTPARFRPSRSRPTTSLIANPSAAHVSVITSKGKQTLRHNPPVFFPFYLFLCTLITIDFAFSQQRSTLCYGFMQCSHAVTLMNGRFTFWVRHLFSSFFFFCRHHKTTAYHPVSTITASVFYRLLVELAKLLARLSACQSHHVPAEIWCITLTQRASTRKLCRILRLQMNSQTIIICEIVPRWVLFGERSSYSQTERILPSCGNIQ